MTGNKPHGPHELDSLVLALGNLPCWVRKMMDFYCFSVLFCFSSCMPLPVKTFQHVRKVVVVIGLGVSDLRRPRI